MIAPMPHVSDRDTLVTGKKFDFVRATLVADDGREHPREYVRHPGAACICPIRLDPETGRKHVVFIRNFRFTLEKPLLELPAGMLEPNEPPLESAGRELIEETGYKAERVHPLGPAFFTSPGLSDEAMHAFAATGLTHVGQQLEGDEHIQIEEVPAEEALRRMDNGELADAKSIVTLLRAHQAGFLQPDTVTP
jgi:ADP-ribose pyrophosphatase